MMWPSERLLAKLTSPEVVTFLTVGGVGYIVDVASFNLLRSQSLLSTADPSYARVLAVALAMVVTYLGNSLLTWRGQAAGDRRRAIALFIVFNVVGLSFSVATLAISHDLLGLTSRLADNISANVIGLALGTVFRYWSYRRFVFGELRSATNFPPVTGPAQGPALLGLTPLPFQALRGEARNNRGGIP